MPVSLMCPECGRAVTHDALPVEKCPQCSEPYPDVLRHQLEHSLAHDLVRKPFLLQLGMYGSALFGIISILGLILAPFDLGTYSVNDQSVSGPEFLRVAGIPFALLGFTCIVIAWGLWKDRWWTRELMLLYWALTAAVVMGLEVSGSSPDPTSVISSLVFVALPALVAWFYLYRRPTVRAYYAAIEKLSSAFGQR